MDYKDFWIKIEARVADGYRVSVVQSPAGGGSDTLPLAFDPDGTGTPLRDAQVRGHTPSSDPHRDIEQASTSAEPRDVGRELFEALFDGTVRSLFDKSLGMAQAQGQGLRIKLQIDPEDAQLAHLAALPWEMLYFHDTRDYLSLSVQTPVVRYLDVQRPLELPPFAEPLRVLVVLANPSDTDALDLEKERALIEKTWSQLDGVQVDFLADATRPALLKALEATPCHVLHYMGHGGFDGQTGAGVLLMEDAEGRSAPITGQALGVLLRDLPSMRLVFLNACDTARSGEDAAQDAFAGVASALVMAGVPAVLAMQFPVSDRAAIAFAEGFYTALARQQPVDAAVGTGRKAIHDARPGSLEWATPVLFLRAPDGYLFKPKRPLFTTKRTWALVVGGLVAVLIAAVGLVLGASKPISLAPDALRVAERRTATIGALSNGEPVTPDTWQSSDTSVVTVRNGVVTARRPGTAQITATLGWFSKGRADVTVFQPDPASLRFARRQASMQAGDTLFVPAAVLSGDGFALDGHTIAWSADDTALVRILPGGRLVGRTPTDRTRTVVRATSGGLTDTLLLTVNRRGENREAPADSAGIAPPPSPAAPTLVRFGLSDKSNFSRRVLPWDQTQPYYAVSTTTGIDDACEARLADPAMLRVLYRYQYREEVSAEELADPDIRGQLQNEYRWALLQSQGMSPLSAQLKTSAAQNWSDVEAPADRAALQSIVRACTPPQPEDALVFSVTLKNPSSAYLNVTDVRYRVLVDGGEAGGGAGAGLLEPLATYLHRVERRCDWRADGRDESYPFALTPILEIAPGRSATFDLQPSLSVRGYENAFLAPLQMQIEIVTDGGTIRTDPFWVEGPSCAG